MLDIVVVVVVVVVVGFIYWGLMSYIKSSTYGWLPLCSRTLATPLYDKYPVRIPSYVQLSTMYFV